MCTSRLCGLLPGEPPGRLPSAHAIGQFNDAVNTWRVAGE